MTTLEFRELLENIDHYMTQGDRLEDLSIWARSILKEKADYLSRLECSRNISVFNKNILFNFLDISSDINLAKSKFALPLKKISPSKPTDQKPAHPQTVQIRARMKTNLDSILKDFLFMTPQETETFSQRIENLIFTEQKDINDYERTIKDYSYCIANARQSPVLARHLFDIGFTGKLLGLLLGASAGVIKRIIDENSLDRFLGGS